MLGHVKTISLVLAVNIIAGGTLAFGQSAIAERTASYKAKLAPGYDVTGIIFDLDDTDPTAVETISFKIAPSYGSAKVDRVEIQTEVDGTWTECSLVDDMAICTFSSLAAEDITALDIAIK